MANELTLTGSLSFEKGSISIDLEKTGLQVTVTGTECIRNTQIVTTSEAALLKGSVTTCGYIIAINRDATNFITIRPATGVVDCIKLKAGEFAVFRFDNTDANVPFVIADTANCVLEYLLIED